MKIQEKRRVKRNTNAIENEIEHKQCRLSKEKEETDHIVILAVVIICMALLTSKFKYLPSINNSVSITCLFGSDRNSSAKNP
jgi:hypothetical protein